MLINILVCIFIIITLFIGGYLLTHRNNIFMTMNPKETPTLHNIMFYGGILCLIIGILEIIALISQNSIFIIISLILAMVSVTIIQFMIFNQLKIK